MQVCHLKIIFREADIVYNEDSHSIIRQREVAHAIARLLALLWCDDALIWSKEGFATFFGAYILDQVVIIPLKLTYLYFKTHKRKCNQQ